MAAPAAIPTDLDPVSILTLDRLWGKLQDHDGCWIWTGSLRGKYGRVKVAGRAYAVHRLVWWALRGELPLDLQPDHLCRKTRCANPEHLDWVTAKVNMHRSMAPSIVSWRTNTCKRGHSLADAFTPPSSGRKCRPCTIEARWRKP